MRSQPIQNKSLHYLFVARELLEAWKHVFSHILADQFYSQFQSILLMPGTKNEIYCPRLDLPTKEAKCFLFYSRNL